MRARSCEGRAGGQRGRGQERKKSFSGEGLKIEALNHRKPPPVMFNERDEKKKKRKKGVISKLFSLNIGPAVSSLPGLRELPRGGRAADGHLPDPAAGSEKG